MTAPRLRDHLRYRFDNLMARGTGAQILLLGTATALLIAMTAIALAIYGMPPDEDGRPPSFAKLLWNAMLHALDAGTVAGDSGSWTLLFIMLADTFGGIFILSALIGVLNNGFGGVIEGLRRGRSPVIEEGHTVILGWSAKIHTMLRELAVASANKIDACVVVLADRDKVAMDEELADVIGTGSLRVVTRSGSPMRLADLELVCLSTSKAVVVLPPDETDASAADATVLKTLLAIAKVAGGARLHVVAELQSESTERVARMVAGPEAALLVSPPLVSRLLVQTGRQSGLSAVYTDLLDFAGMEIYLQAVPSLVGKSFREAAFAFDDSTVIGVRTAAGELRLVPPADLRIAAGDELVAISADDGTVVTNARPSTIDPATVIAAPRQATRMHERALVLGASQRLALVLRELDSYAAPGSEVIVVGEELPAALGGVATPSLVNLTIDRRSGDVTDRGLLESLEVARFSHILVLSESVGRTQELADARTMTTLLHLRDILRSADRAVPITSEILEIESRDLAAVAEADDFIVSNTLVSLMLTQVSENRHLVGVFDELFSANGVEIYLKPAELFVRCDVEVPFEAVAEAALRRGELAIGLRRAAEARMPERAFGVVLNPAKHAPVRLTTADRVIVLADE